MEGALRKSIKAAKALPLNVSTSETIERRWLNVHVGIRPIPKSIRQLGDARFHLRTSTERDDRIAAQKHGRDVTSQSTNALNCRERHPFDRTIRFRQAVDARSGVARNVSEPKNSTVVSSTGTESAERVADVLLAFLSFQDTVGVSALARVLSISKAVIHRILQSLVSRGLVEYIPQTREYRLGPGAAAIGARALRQLDIRRLARESLITLRDQTRETTTLTILANDMRSYVDQYESPQEIKMTVELGRFYPLYAGASGRAILAFLPEADIDRITDRGLTPLTEATILNPEELRKRLEQVRTDGYATSRGERESGAGAIAAPVFGADGRVIGAISTCGPIARYDAESIARYIPLVKDAAQRITSEIAGNWGNSGRP